MTSYLRPDEEAMYSDIERSQNFDNNIKRGIKTVANLGLTATGLGMSSRLLPLLNPLVPKDLALKGISKINPSVGKFLKKGLEQGLNLQDGFDFIKENLGQKKEENTKENRNVIEQYSPELFQELNQHIQRGMNPLQAGAIVESEGKFSKIIKKMISDHKIPWSAILQTTFGGQEQSQPQQQQAQQQEGPGAQKLMAILQQLQQSRGQG